MSVVSYFNERFTDFRMLLFKPQMGARRLVRKAGLGTGVRLLALFAFLAGLLSVMLLAVGTLIGSLIKLVVGGGIDSVVEAAIGSILSIIAYIILFLPLIIGLILVLVVWFGMVWGTAKLLGGKSDYGMHFGMLVYPIVLFMLLSAFILGVMNLVAAVFMPVIPILALIVVWGEALILLLLVLHCLWLKITVTAEAHQFDMLRAGAAVVVPSALLGLASAIILVVFSAILATLVGLSIPTF